MLPTHPLELGEAFGQVWPIIWLFDTGRYLVAAGLMAVILRVFWRAGLSARKIQAFCPMPRDMRREIVTSLRTAAIFSLLGFGLYVAASHGWIMLYADFGQRGVGYLLLTLTVMIVAHDAYFYWTHRLMHHRRLFRWFHLTHHESQAPTPWAAYAFATPEALVQGAFVPLFVAVVPTHELALFVFMAFQIVRNVMGHAGVEVYPPEWPDRCGSAGTTPRPITTCIIRPAVTISGSISAGGIGSWAPSIRNTCSDSRR
jgi:Delta7-sterol 5-desaturase